MKHINHIVGMCSVLTIMGLVLLAPPQPAHARVSIGVDLGVPPPVVVAPAPGVVVRRGYYRSYPRRHYYQRYYHRSYYRYPHQHWRHHHHGWSRW